MSQAFPVSEIVTTAKTQCRLTMCKETVIRYSEMLGEAKGKWPFPDLKLTSDGESYYLASGFHRLAAAKVNGLSEVPVEIFAGGVTEAFKIGLEDNEGPMSPTQADRRYAAERLLQEDNGLNKTEIAALCGLTRRTVHRIAAELNGSECDNVTLTNDQDAEVEGVNDEVAADTEVPPPPDRERRTGSGGGSSNSDTKAPQRDPVKIQKAKTVKTAEALGRAFGDLHELQPGREYKAAIDACLNLIGVAQNWH